MGNTVLLSHLQALRSTIGYHYHSSAILSCQVGLKLPQMASWHEACFLFDILVQLIAFLNITPYFSETLLGGGVIFFFFSGKHKSSCPGVWGKSLVLTGFWTPVCKCLLTDVTLFTPRLTSLLSLSGRWKKGKYYSLSAAFHLPLR